MGERALGWGLRLLGLFLAIGPFLIALGMHNWNIQAAVLPSGAEMSQATDMLSGIFGGEGLSLEDMFPIENLTENLTYNPGNNTVKLPVPFTSPFKIPVKITEVSLSVTSDNVKIADVQLEEEVEVPAEDSTTITLVGTYTTIALNPQFENARIAFEVYGVTVEMQLTQAQGGS